MLLARRAGALRRGTLVEKAWFDDDLVVGKGLDRRLDEIGRAHV